MRKGSGSNAGDKAEFAKSGEGRRRWMGHGRIDSWYTRK